MTHGTKTQITDGIVSYQPPEHIRDAFLDMVKHAPDDLTPVDLVAFFMRLLEVYDLGDMKSVIEIASLMVSSAIAQQEVQRHAN